MSNEALRLADSCEQAANIIDMGRPAIQDDWRRRSAAELRRQHEELLTTEAAYQTACSELRKQDALIAELVEALERVNAWSETLWPETQSQPSSIAAQVRAALSKAKEQP